MRLLRSLLRRSKSLLHGDVENSALSEEIQFHLERATEENIARGMLPMQARGAAMADFGSVAGATEHSYRARGATWIDDLIQDIRYGWRTLIKTPSFALITVLTLSLGIAASVSIFSLVDAALLKPLAYPHPDQLVEVTESISLLPRASLSYPDYLDWKKFNQVFRSMEAFRPTAFLLTTASGTEPVPGELVSDGFFRTLGVAPLLGRDFYTGEDLPSGPESVILSYSTWQKRYGGQKDVIGKAVALSGIQYTIVGVMPQSFEFAPRNNAEFWTTLHANDACSMRRNCHNLTGLARLKDDVSVKMALANMVSIALELETQYPVTNRGQGASVMSLFEATVGDIRPILLILMGGAGLLLLIACINVLSLLLLRSESRKREIAVRGALGASPARLNRQFITEGLMLSSAGCGIGVIIAYGMAQLLVQLVSRDMIIHMPYLRGLGLNIRVMGFVAAVYLLMVLLFSLTPILRLSFAEIRDGLTEGTRGISGRMWRRLGANLVVFELAIAVILLVGAGLLSKSLYKLLHVQLNFQPKQIATAVVLLPETVYTKGQQVVAVHREIERRVARLPSIVSVSSSTVLPTSCNCNTGWIRFVGRPYDGKHIEVLQRDVTAGYFATLETPLLRGRFFSSNEDATKPLVAIVNKAFTKAYFPGQDPIGKRIGNTELAPESIKEIVGVVDDVREASLDDQIVPAVYYPIEQNVDRQFNLVVRTSRSDKRLLALLAPTIHKIDPAIGVVEQETMMQHITGSQAAYLHRSAAWLISGFSVLALLLGTIGLYGVISYSVSQRTREIGVRMALGAQRASVYQMVLLEGGRLAALGIGSGLMCSLAMTMLLRSMLFGVQSWDTATLTMVVVVLATAAVSASYFPARRAASINPVEALRAE
jgi:macrolide transport system ATP-binding/permease protein